MSPPPDPPNETVASATDTLADSNELPQAFSEPTRQWFQQSFAAATRVQQLGWRHLVEGDHALLVAPTGSGKTLAAFLWGIDRCAQLAPDAEKGVRVLYVSPLKALAVDIERNLRAPLVGIQNAAHRLGEPVRESAVHVRTGDTPSRDRARQARNPCDIVVTTPESLFLTLGSQAATTLDTVDWVIVDEIHVFAPTKRGVHLALSLERLAERTLAARGVEPQRIGLSATVKPPDEVAKFLGGDRPVEIVDASGRSFLELKVRVPVPDMENVPPEQRVDASPTRAADSDALMGPHKTAYLQEIGALPGSAGPSASASGFGSSAEQPSYGSTAYPKPGERTGIWPTVYPELIELILQHRSTIVFTNSRGLCERLSQRLNELWAERVRAEHAESMRPEHDDEDSDVENGPEPEHDELEVADLVAAHHGSVSHVRRAEIEERLKAGRLRCIVATSSLELGIDMGAVDLVVLVESPGSVARGLQRVGRSGHGVGELSRGVVFPKFKGDLLECAVVSQRMLEGSLEPISTPTNPLDVLAQQVAAACVDKDRSPAEILQLVRRSFPYHELSEELLGGVLDMLSGRFPSDDFADLRPRLSWDRTKDLLSARRGTKQVTLLNAGTIPDRGLYSVHLGADGPRIGELDEEMVYESRSGDVILLGATSWRVLEITRDRVLVEPAPGEPGRMPFWRGDGPGRPIELGRALGGFLREMNGLDQTAMEERLQQTTPLERNSISNLCLYLEEQKEATGALPNDRLIVVERFRDEIGDWRICLLTPFGSRVHAPWAMALQQALSERAGFDIETMYTDDGIVLRLADLSGEADQVPDVSQLFPDADEVEDLVVDQVGSSALFASRFRENAARALLMPRRRAQGRTPLWLQRLRSKTLLAGVRKFANFPIVLETYRECLRDVFDLPALVEVLRQVSDRTIRVTEVETPSASPFARSLVYAYVAQYLYEQDSPLAERKAQALTLDRNLLRELVGQAELRELLDPQAIDDVEAELQCLATDRRARDVDEVHDLLRRLGDLTFEEIVERCAPRELATVARGDQEQDDAPAAETAPREEIEALVRSQLDELLAQRRIGAVRLGVTTGGRDPQRFIASEDAGRYRDALGVQPPAGLPQTLLEPVDRALESLVQRWAKTHGPFHTDEVAGRFALLPAQIEPLLENLERQGTLTRGEIRPGGTQREWCDVEVLRRIKRRTLARLRGEVAPVGATVLARYLPRWHGLEPIATGSIADPRNHPSLGPRPAGYQPPARSRPHPEAQLDEALSLLEGLALPWSTLGDALLPARVDGFRPESLDLRAASGELVWLGRGALGPKDGRTALLRRDTAAQLARSPKGDDERPGEPIHRALLDLLDQRGACFTTELHQRLRRGSRRNGEGDGEDAAPFPDLRTDELETALWDLVWAGLVTNDTFLPLRTLVGRSGRGRTGGSSRPRAGRPRFAPTRRGARGAPAGTLAGGRWSLVQDLLDPEHSDTEWAWTTANLLLERYGVISRETALAEEVPGGFAALYPTLRAMEDAGRVRRGYFVEGLSGRQFALAGAVERLREARREQEQHLDTQDVALDLLAAVDPANPYGALLPWPEGRVENAPRPRRVAGAWVVIADGELLAFVESGVRSLLTFGPAFARSGTRPACELLTAALLDLMKRRRSRSLRVTKLDGAPAGQSQLVGELLSCGWQADDPGLRLSVDR